MGNSSPVPQIGNKTAPGAQGGGIIILVWRGTGRGPQTPVRSWGNGPSRRRGGLAPLGVWFWGGTGVAEPTPSPLPRPEVTRFPLPRCPTLH